MSKAQFFKVKSFSDPSKNHLVRYVPGNGWKCDCPHFIFNERRLEREGRSSKCDHIKRHLHIKLKHHGRRK